MFNSFPDNELFFGAIKTDCKLENLPVDVWKATKTEISSSAPLISVFHIYTYSSVEWFNLRPTLNLFLLHFPTVTPENSSPTRVIYFSVAWSVGVRRGSPWTGPRVGSPWTRFVIGVRRPGTSKFLGYFNLHLKNKTFSEQVLFLL